MIETIIYILIFWIVIRAVANAFASAYTSDKEEDIEIHLERKKVVIVSLKMENINEWWYGFYTPKGSTGEVFVAQGTTYEEAVKNCKERLSNDKYEFKLEFEKNETKYIQN